jgi:hypothetical protein
VSGRTFLEWGLHDTLWGEVSHRIQGRKRITFLLLCFSQISFSLLNIPRYHICRYLSWVPTLSWLDNIFVQWLSDHSSTSSKPWLLSPSLSWEHTNQKLRSQDSQRIRCCQTEGNWELIWSNSFTPDIGL